MTKWHRIHWGISWEAVHLCCMSPSPLAGVFQLLRKKLCEDEEGVLQIKLIPVSLYSLRSSCRSSAPLAAWIAGWVERFSCWWERSPTSQNEDVLANALFIIGNSKLSTNLVQTLQSLPYCQLYLCGESLRIDKLFLALSSRGAINGSAKGASESFY